MKKLFAGRDLLMLRHEGNMLYALAHFRRLHLNVITLQPPGKEEFQINKKRNNAAALLWGWSTSGWCSLGCSPVLQRVCRLPGCESLPGPVRECTEQTFKSSTFDDTLTTEHHAESKYMRMPFGPFPLTSATR
ncbi:MAG TPA: hypothetical protein VEY06_01725 [Flavisolibacter sp.]|nr:hypothetical protein [Flavisolibacter sp.]